eukprot:c11060_g1_i2.p1 GENE.c11060_g1_i2~~c11060_g1_i2.p1  ORF type:complete len:648 (+),score=75.74 c11060_g1_i2:161-1945(+)
MDLMNQHFAQRLSSRSQSEMETLQLPGNDLCADCARPNPDWVHLEHGVFLCLDCCGVHRSFSNKLRSFLFDNLTREEHQKLRELGNERVNKVWEASLQESERPHFTADDETRKRFIYAKWVDGSYKSPLLLPPLSNPSDTSLPALPSPLHSNSSMSASPCPSPPPLFFAGSQFSPDDPRRPSPGCRSVGVLVFCDSADEETFVSALVPQLRKAISHRQNLDYQREPFVVRAISWKAFDRHAPCLDGVRRVGSTPDRAAHHMHLAWIASLPPIPNKYEDLCDMDQALLEEATAACDSIGRIIGEGCPVMIVSSGLGSLLAVRYLSILSTAGISSGTPRPFPMRLALHSSTLSGMTTNTLSSPHSTTSTSSSNSPHTKRRFLKPLVGCVFVVRRMSSQTKRFSPNLLVPPTPLSQSRMHNSDPTCRDPADDDLEDDEDDTVVVVEGGRRGRAFGVRSRSKEEDAQAVCSRLAQAEANRDLQWSPIASGETVCLLVTIGCPQPLLPLPDCQVPRCAFSLPHKKFSAHNLPKLLHRGWLNFHAPQDPFSFPMTTHYRNQSVCDVAVHIKGGSTYMKEKTVLRHMRETMSEIVARLNSA